MPAMTRKRTFIILGVFSLLMGSLLIPILSIAADLEGNVFNRNGRAIGRVDADGTIVFVEVKAKADEAFTDAESLVTGAKQTRLSKAARFFIKTHNLHDRPCRFDVLTGGVHAIQRKDQPDDVRPGLRKRLGGLQRRPCRRAHVLHEQHSPALHGRALQELVRTVALPGLANDGEGFSAGE